MNLDALRTSTGRFFELHWPTKELGAEPPSWLGPYQFTGETPYPKAGGCYALFNGSSLRYVGLGASRGGGAYVEHGIARRLMSHVMRADKTKGRFVYMPRKGWEHITAVYTIGFPLQASYLAPALEDFLIGELGPPDNRAKRKEP